MDLSYRSEENVAFIIEAITTKLRMATAGAIKSSHFDGERYEDLVEIYEIVNSKSNFSISEVEAIVAELGRLRK